MRRTTRLDPKPGYRWCSQCGEERPIEEFAAYPSYKDGLDPYCRKHRAEARDKSRGKPVPPHIQLLKKIEENATNGLSTARLMSPALLAAVSAYFKEEGYPRIAEALKEMSYAMDSDVR